MKRWIPIILTVMLLLSGCDAWNYGEWFHVTPHQEKVEQPGSLDVEAKDYSSLIAALTATVESGAESGLIFVPRYDQSAVEKDVQRAVEIIMQINPFAAYAVENIRCQLGTKMGQSAIAVEIDYRYDKNELSRVVRVKNMEEGNAIIAKYLDACADRLLLYYESYKEVDFVQLVDDYADTYPQRVMETPQVKVSTYPDNGLSRIVELRFSYQTSRETLRSYQTTVGRIFESAALYVSSDASAQEKYVQLYSFLMQLDNYELKTSITPAYSLLRHGEGNAKAFATVYAAMCRQSGLNCMVVTGTRQGEAWYWNLVEDEVGWHHVDVIRCSQEGGFRKLEDQEMETYVWDYAGYPAAQTPPQSTEPTTE